jgi:hypothetical protein
VAYQTGVKLDGYRRKQEASAAPASPTGSRNGWWMDNCPKHGHTSFNTVVEGCEQCARERLEEK